MPAHYDASVATLRHDLWVEPDGQQTFCLAGPLGDDARGLLAPGAQLVWHVEAESHFKAMTLYHEHMGWSPYTSEYAWDRQPYPDDWQRIQPSDNSETLQHRDLGD